jgi:hypothetical protein
MGASAAPLGEMIERYVGAREDVHAVGLGRGRLPIADPM